jgi:alkanesulfonate monooxygenase SsuD/methylene tetrahydromethanopterin reductase-like flavin-dependent oxidoreductase (luciferase family)
MAAQLGLPFAYAHFFGIAVEEGPAIAANYRENFKPSQYLSEPKVNVGVHVVCAETEEEAQRLAGPRNLARLQNITGRAKGIPSLEEAMTYQYTRDEYRFVQQYAEVCVDGDPQQVKEGLDDIAEMYQTDDLSIVTICHDYADRRRSYELVAGVCGVLTPENTEATGI